MSYSAVDGFGSRVRRVVRASQLWLVPGCCFALVSNAYGQGDSRKQARWDEAANPFYVGVEASILANTDTRLASGAPP